MNTALRRLLIEWKSTQLDRKIELFLILGGMVIAGFVLINSMTQLEQMSTQTKAMQGQLNEMKSGGEQAEKVIKEMKRLADSTEASIRQSDAVLRHNIETSHLDQRAWIGLKEMNMRSLTGDIPIRIDFKLTNTGKTSGFEVKIAAGVFIRMHGAKIEPNLAKRERSQHPVIFPSAVTFEVVEGAIRSTQEEIDSIKTGKTVLYLVGEIDYRDVFHESHITEFCGFYRPDKGAFYSCNEHQRAT